MIRKGIPSPGGNRSGASLLEGTKTIQPSQYSLRWSSRGFWILAFGVMALALVYTALTRPIDYDEFLHVHSLWLISVGKVPYTEFLAVHPPVFWYLFTPLFSMLPQRLDSILILRIVNILFSLLLLCALGRLLARRLPGTEGTLAICLAFLVNFFQPSVLCTLAEFRMDHLSTALLLSGLVCYEEDGGKRRSQPFGAGMLVAVALSMNPKLILMPAFVLCVDIFGVLGRQPVNWRKLLLVTAGFGFGLLLTSGFLVLQRVNLSEASQFIYGYHARIAREYDGLKWYFVALNTRQHQLPLLLLLLGLAGIGAGLRNHELARNKVVLSLFLFSIFQALVVPFPFKQYACSVFLMWTVPLALAFERILVWRARAGLAVVGLLAVGALGICAGSLKEEPGSSILNFQRDSFEQLRRLVPAGSTLLGVMTVHPIFREDAAFVFFTTLTPEPKLVETLHHLRPNDARFTTDGLLQQIRMNRPSLVMQSEPLHDPALFRAVQVYLKEEGAHYIRIQNEPGLSVYQRV